MTCRSNLAVAVCRPGEVEVATILHEVARTLACKKGHEARVRGVLLLLETKLGMHPTLSLRSQDGTEWLIDNRNEEGDALDSILVSNPTWPGQTCTSAMEAWQPMDCRVELLRQPSDQDAQDQFIQIISVAVCLGQQFIGTLSAQTRPLSPHVVDTQSRALRIVASMIAHDARALLMIRIRANLTLGEEACSTTATGRQPVPVKIVGSSLAMLGLYARIGQVSPSNTTVLIRGESGTGKELVASAIHAQSLRAGKPLLKVNCAAMNDQLLLSELFGHEKGAFTGAFRTRVGRIEEAAGGTVFLDEIGDFSTSTQVKLLRVLQEHEFERVGSNRTQRADVRIVCATNRDLEALIASHLFREDFYYRINVFPITLPPLRQRREDILPLTNYFMSRQSTALNKAITRICPSALNLILGYDWPGNVRELENCIEHATLLAQDGVIRETDLPPALQCQAATDDAPLSLTCRVKSLERRLIREALRRHSGNAVAAGRELGITARVLRYKARLLGIAGKWGQPPRSPH